MNLNRLALKGVTRSPFRSWMVFICAMLVAGLALATVLLTQGAQDSLRLALDRLGADIVVVPKGAESSVESALLMGTPTDAWMPAAKLDELRAVQGVSAASPQVYLATLTGASCCAVENMFIVAYDPTSDFTLGPWLEETVGSGLDLGEVVGGTYVFVPEGEQNIKIYNYLLTLRANLEPTGTNLDQSMFMTLETAKDVSRISRERNAEEPLDVPSGEVSAVLLRVADGDDPEDVAVDIVKEVPDVTPIVSPKMFGTFRQQMSALLSSMVAILGLTLALSLGLIAAVFSLAAHERRREIGVFRALGATRTTVVRSMVTEAAVLATAGALVGIVLATLGIYLFRGYIVRTVGFPFLFPSIAELGSIVVFGLIVALSGVVLAALIPAVRASLQDPAVAMRE